MVTSALTMIKNGKARVKAQKNLPCALKMLMRFGKIPIQCRALSVFDSFNGKFFNLLSRSSRAILTYATSKAALAALTREMAHDFGPLGVRVNAIAPGEIETSILSEGTDEIVETLPMKRLGQPREVANTIFFLCSENSSYVSGTEIEGNGAQHV